MKKFLALFLVLVMALSVVLVSCGGNEDEPDNSDDEFLGMNTPAPTTTGTPTSAPEPTDQPSDKYSWTEDTAGTLVYIRVDELNVRSDTITSEDTKVGVAKFGESYTRVKYNSQWTMISYKGTNRYVATAYVTADNGSVLFDKVEDKTVYVNVENTLFLRSSTFVTNPDGSKYEANIKVTLKRGAQIVQTGVSKNGNWARVIYDGDTLYCNTSFLSDTVPGDSTDSPVVTPPPVG